MNAAILAALSMAATAPAAEPPTEYFTLAIGSNSAPAPGGTPLEPLKYADDDAAGVHRLASELGHTAILLAAFDAETQRRFPDQARDARPPTLAELRRAVGELEAAITTGTRRGHRTSLLIFYSGHGVRGGEGGGGLVLADGRLTHERLYEEVLGRLHPTAVNLIVDACHAEAVVRPRDLTAHTIDTPADDLAGYLGRRTLAAFPHVGAVVASTASGETHEWDRYHGGVFTHEVLSGLRGAADIDGDRRIEYSELAAFLAAANRLVSDPRARPSTLVRAPQRLARTALVDLRPTDRTSTLAGEPAALGPLYVEDARGNRLLSLHAELGHKLALLVPAGIDLFIRSKGQEAEARLEPRAELAFERLSWRPIESRARGSIDHSLRQGLFASRFGPAYYSGFLDRSDDLSPVTIPALAAASPAPAARARPVGRYLAWGAGLSLAAGSGILGGMALSERAAVSSSPERQSTVAHDRYVRYGTAAIVTGVAAAAALVTGYILGK